MSNWDWEILRGPVIWLVSAFIVSIVITVISFQYYQTIQSDYMAKNRSLLIAQQRNAKALDDSKVLTELLPRFTALRAAGVIGDEQRLNWVETIRDLGEHLKMRSLDYRIDEQFPYKTGGENSVDNAGNLQVYASLMNVKMQFLHEGDLLILLRALRHRAKGLFHIEACDVKRLQVNVITDGRDPNLITECDLLWLTVQYEKRLELVSSE